MLVKPLRAQAIALFRDTFVTAPSAVASAPGWVNLLGDHTDYNGGPVLAIATPQRIAVAVGPGEDGFLEAISTADGRRERFDLREAQASGYLAYLSGVVRELAGEWGRPKGARVAVASDLPIGVGLPVPTGAALAVATARALAALAGLSLTVLQLARVAFRAEHDHVRRDCGLVGHTIAAQARSGEALLIECASAATRRVPFPGALLVVESGFPLQNERADGLLKIRRAECEAAVARLKVELPELMWLASWPSSWVARLKKALPEPLRSRALHVTGETARTRFGAQLLARGRRARLGELMFESHESCRRLYDFSAPELDLLVAAAKRGGAAGARVSVIGDVLILVGKGERGRGKGFKRLSEAIRKAFSKTFGRDPAIREVRADAGVRCQVLGVR